MKPIVAFRNFAKASKSNTCDIQIMRILKDMLGPLEKMENEGGKLMWDKAMKKKKKKAQ